MGDEPSTYGTGITKSCTGKIPGVIDSNGVTAGDKSGVNSSEVLVGKILEKLLSAALPLLLLGSDKSINFGTWVLKIEEVNSP